MSPVRRNPSSVPEPQQDTYPATVSYFDDEAATGSWARRYEVADGRWYPFHVRRQRVMELLPEELGRVVDLGCGPGIMAPLIRARGGSFLGIDVSSKMVSEAEAAYGSPPDVCFAVGNAEQLDLPDESVDQVICIGVIEYLQEPQRAFAEMARILRPGGVAIVSVSRKYHTDRLAAPMTAPIRWVARSLGFAGSGQVRRIAMQPRELHALAAAEGLVPEDFSNYSFTPLPYPLTRIAPSLTMRVNRPFERFHRVRNPLVASLARGFLCRYRKPLSARAGQ